MKDIVLVAVNAKYIHTNLAVRSLKAQLPEFNIDILEVSINDPMHRIIKQLLAIETKKIGFSCYIWNMEIILKLAEILKKAKPQVQILFGGPEVSFDAKALLESYPFCDLIIQGDGEQKLKTLLESSGLKENLNIIPGLCYRDELGVIQENEDETPPLLNELNFPYHNADMGSLNNKIVYYETMRGCPFSCSYCLSSAKQGLNMLALERVYSEMDFFIRIGVKQVKLVDRTFNCDISRAKSIFGYLIKQGGKTNFHFEMTGDLIDDEMISLIKTAPPGLIQFEIGVQSTDPTTLEAIGRKISLTRTEANVRKLMDAKNIHIHLDLIAGLPYETYNIFKSSFNRVITLNPDMLQLGFLKCLKGTRIRYEAALHDYRYSSFPPYEIISNKYISSNELYQLREIEALVDRYFNSGALQHTMNFLIRSGIFKTPFDFFEQFSSYWSKQGYFDVGKSKEQLYAILQGFFDGHDQSGLLREWIKFDYLAQGNLRLLPGMVDNCPEKEWIFEFLKIPQNIATYLNDYGALAPKKIFNHVKFQYFSAAFAESLNGKALSEEMTKCLIVFTETSFEIIF